VGQESRKELAMRLASLEFEHLERPVSDVLELFAIECLPTGAGIVAFIMQGEGEQSSLLLGDDRNEGRRKREEKGKHQVPGVEVENKAPMRRSCDNLTDERLASWEKATH
jgi:hypothetical protein